MKSDKTFAHSEAFVCYKRKKMHRQEVMDMEFSHELVIPNEDLPFRMFIFEGKDGGYVREKHWHRSIEIFAVFEGDIEFFINSEEYHLLPGDFILVNSNEIHSIRAPRTNQTIVLQIPLKVFEKYYTGEQFIRFSHSSRIQDDQVTQLIASMYRTYGAKQCGYELKVQSEFFMLVYLLVTKYRETKVTLDILRYNKKLNRLLVITAYIRDNYTKEMSLEIMEIFGYSPAYLSGDVSKVRKNKL